MIVYLTYLTSAMVIITKWFDCTTTLKHINCIAMESNPIARALMNKFGIKGTIWGIFTFAIVITAISQYWIQFSTTSILCEYGYILTGTFTAMIQGATALNNHQGRPNFVTLVILKRIRQL